MVRDSIGFLTSYFRHQNLQGLLSIDDNAKEFVISFEDMKRLDGDNLIRKYNEYLSSAIRLHKQKDILIHFTNDPKSINKKDLIGKINDYFSFGFTTQAMGYSASDLSVSRICKNVSENSPRLTLNSFLLSDDVAKYVRERTEDLEEKTRELAIYC